MSNPLTRGAKARDCSPVTAQKTSLMNLNRVPEGSIDYTAVQDASDERVGSTYFPTRKVAGTAQVRGRSQQVRDTAFGAVVKGDT